MDELVENVLKEFHISTTRKLFNLYAKSNNLNGVHGDEVLVLGTIYELFEICSDDEHPIVLRSKNERKSLIKISVSQLNKIIKKQNN